MQKKKTRTAYIISKKKIQVFFWLIKVLANQLCFYLVLGLIISLAISETILIKKKIIIGFLDFIFVIGSNEFSKILNSQI